MINLYSHFILTFFPDNQNEILNLIIQMITETNSFAFEQTTVLGQGGRVPMKIKLIDGDPIKTREMLDPKLRELGLDDILPKVLLLMRRCLIKLLT